MIYGLGQGVPTVVHDSIESANREAERLARSVPGTPFYVLATVGCAIKADVEFRQINVDDIPF